MKVAALRLFAFPLYLLISLSLISPLIYALLVLWKVPETRPAESIRAERTLSGESQPPPGSSKSRRRHGSRWRPRSTHGRGHRC